MCPKCPGKMVFTSANKDGETVVDESCECACEEINPAKCPILLDIGISKESCASACSNTNCNTWVLTDTDGALYDTNKCYSIPQSLAKIGQGAGE
jgi:hypothetical protein